MKVIARIYTDFKEKFGIPRQSGIAGDTLGRIVFEPEYRCPDALRGIEGYSHLWLIWEFSKAISDMKEHGKEWSPTVRPPRLGGNKRMGVFATRSPYRPNPVGLSSVKLLRVEHTKNDGDVLIVSGADILNGTPIYDIKPYLAYTDSHPEAVGGFSDGVKDYALKVEISGEQMKLIAPEKRSTLMTLLENDPRPSYRDDPEREYGMLFADFEFFFKVKDGVLSVTRIEKQR